MFFSFLRYLGFKLRSALDSEIRPRSALRLFHIHCYDERYEVIATPINSNKFTDFDLKKVKKNS